MSYGLHATDFLNRLFSLEAATAFLKMSSMLPTPMTVFMMFFLE